MGLWGWGPFCYKYGVPTGLGRNAGTGDDSAGPVMIGFIGTFASSVVAAVAAVLQTQVQRVIDTKKRAFHKNRFILPSNYNKLTSLETWGMTASKQRAIMKSYTIA